MSNPKQNKADKIVTRITSVLSIIILAGLGFWGIRVWLNAKAYEETNDAQVEEYINPIAVKVSGYIQEIRFEENQDVQRGDTLLIIDNSEYLSQQEEASASLQNAKAQLNVLESGIHTQEKTATVTVAQIEAAKAKLWKAQQEFDRYKKLLASEAVTQQQFENISTALDVAKADYQATQDAYTASLAKVTDIAMQKQAASSEIKRKEAVLHLHNIQVGYTVITAPYTGKMGRRTVQEGQLVSAGQTIGFIVNHEAGKWVVANFKETQVRNMYVGEESDIELDAYPGKIFKGKIESLSGATGSKFSLLPPDNATGNFVKIAQRIPVRIRLMPATDSLQGVTAGMSATVIIKKQKA
ncbi:membrane fusion protein, multidrug efflux system [Filimonas lacunae]|uniref:Membrane fusion protein, multidrug efflux system n=1 Tax=Filimonas lacunae TaxID=477680 RepID=A0A173MGP0_9BACT|nr:HlyD family secretion protein [Filimonas lacunae]BAV06637.1 membrane fusion component of tripartite multidrug resistance system [Filimonas lacunae]SIT27698.1 membrane fusion protein, multidrug efflux system [Filimonas lacunae]